MPFRVLEASGHVERFNDYMVKDTTDAKKFYRADKLLEVTPELTPHRIYRDVRNPNQSPKSKC